MYSPKEVNLDITAESAVWNTEDDQLEVNWEDGHTSQYSFEWLKYLRYRPPGEGQPDGVLKKGIKLWGQELSEEGNLPTFQFQKLLNDDQELYKWLVTLEIETGIAKIENAPKEGNQLPVLGERVGYLMRICYRLVSLLMLTPLVSQ
ncbi:Hypothetical predicted protein [Paramuricea clavata]|uniref:Uncharacterized protein n=1 Tax=Paramuricea clavata TaxID=317549 RepID=A0A6S7HKB5_PARCT|nr:Hypothetical predicted protein [Paramuricea clavata]